MRRLALPLLAALACACGVKTKIIDPAPTLPSLEPAAEILPAPPSPAPAPAPDPAPAPAPAPEHKGPEKAAPAPKAPPKAAAPEKRREWGRVAITTAVLSPAQLIGPEIAFSTDFRRLPAFPEKLVYQMSWGLLDVGEATLEVRKIVLFNGRPAYHLISQARSNSFCDSFYPVRDLNESWLDARTLSSLGYSKKLREGRFFRDEWVLFDRDENSFVSRITNKDGSFRVRTGTIPAQVQDVLSSIYFTRAQDLPDGGQVVVDVNTPDNWPLVVKVTGRESVKVPVGRIKSVLVEPMLRKEGLFVQKGKRLRLWLSDDPAKRVVMMKAEVFFGHVTAALREML